jgi:hypothetical protein
VPLLVLRRVRYVLLLLLAVNSFLFANSFVQLQLSFLADLLFLFDVYLLFSFVVGCLSFSFGQLLVEFSIRLFVFLSASVS